MTIDFFRILKLKLRSQFDDDFRTQAKLSSHKSNFGRKLEKLAVFGFNYSLRCDKMWNLEIFDGTYKKVTQLSSCKAFNLSYAVN